MQLNLSENLMLQFSARCWRVAALPIKPNRISGHIPPSSTSTQQPSTRSYDAAIDADAIFIHVYISLWRRIASERFVR